jgi:hypothetical protein
LQRPSQGAATVKIQQAAQSAARSEAKPSEVH